jgi:hypothetical protein
MYKLVKTNRGESLNRNNEDGSVTCIPFAPDNTDYQEYLKWIADGNQPLPAEE